MTKVNFYYCNGTAYLWNFFGVSFSILNGEFALGDRVLNPNTSVQIGTLPGQNGKTYTGPLGPDKDCFPFMLNPDIWNATKVTYPASTLAMGPSIDVGVDNTVKLIQATPPGQPFAIGGYSQGAAVMSNVLKEIQNPSGRLYNRRGDCIGGVCFGNPMRKTNWRGPVGGTWSGTADSNTNSTGGHGSFPATGKYARLNTEINGFENKWVEFAAPTDIITCVGDNQDGLDWSSANGLLLNLTDPVGAVTLLTYLGAAAIGLSVPQWSAFQKWQAYCATMYFIDVAGVYGTIPGGGHVTYPIWPPPNNDGSYTGLLTSVAKPGGTYYKPATNVKTCYQLALDWLDSKAAEWATAPLVLSNNYQGWSATLAPPAA
jgi:hypothetical protein